MSANRPSVGNHLGDGSGIHHDHDDRHCPHVHCHTTARRDAPFPVTICVDGACSHPDKKEHHISSVALYDGTRLLGEANFPSGTRGGEDPKAQLEVTFKVLPTGRSMQLKAMAYCTQHGLWEGATLDVSVED